MSVQLLQASREDTALLHSADDIPYVNTNNNTGATVRVVPHIIDIYYTLLQHLNLYNELPIELQQLRTLFIQL